MSQEKVDHNKELKKNRKKIVRRSKRNAKIAMIIAIAVAIVAVWWIVYSIQGRVEQYHEDNPKTVTVDLSDIFNYSVDSNSDSDTNQSSTDTSSSGTAESEAADSAN